MQLRRFVRWSGFIVASVWMTGCQSATDTVRYFSPPPIQATIQLAPADRSNVAVATRAIQAAIDSAGRLAEAQNASAKVTIAQGDYTVGPLSLRSHVELSLDAGATLHFSRDPADYPLTRVDDGDGPVAGVLSPLHGENLTNVSITGQGVIDGQGDAWRSIKKVKLSDKQWDDLQKSGGVLNKERDQWFPSPIVRDAKQISEKFAAAKSPVPLSAYEPYRQMLRPHLIRLTNCRGVTIEGVTFRNGASWNVHLALCDNVRVSRIVVETKEWAQNGDGIDLDSCRNVRLTDSIFNAGDDAICLKSGKDAAGRARGRPTENVVISRCTIGTGHGGVVIGSEMSGGVRNIDVSDCTFTGTGAGLRFKSTRGRGGTVENVKVRNVKMTNIHGTAILFDLFYAANGKPGPALKVANETTPAFRNFDLRDITCDGAETAMTIRGLKEMPVRNIRLTDVTLRAKKAGQISEAESISLTRVHVTAADGPVKVDPTAKIEMIDCRGIGQ